MSTNSGAQASAQPSQGEGGGEARDEKKWDRQDKQEVERAATLKAHGNTAFECGRISEALDFYNEAHLALGK